MNKTSTAFYSLCSLSVFRGILERSVVKGYYKLLKNVNSEPEEFLNAYGEFYSLLCERGVAGNLAYTLTEAALFDENAFSLAAAGGDISALPQNVIEAVMRDCGAIKLLCSLTPEDILNDCLYGEDMIGLELPRWTMGEPASAFSGEKLDLQRLAAFYRENGCGIFARYKAFVWRDGDIRPVEHPDSVDMDDFTGYERQRGKVVENTLAFIEGKSCNNCLLYGDMGTGKSSTVKAIANEFRGRGLRVVEMPKERLMDFPLLVDKIAALPMKFIIFIDDLSFRTQDESYTSLKAVLEGGLAARPKNALIYATSNRRHIIKESWADRDTDDINRRDNMQESLSLSDRFGLAICYTVPDKREFLEIVSALAEKSGLSLSADELAKKAERFALERGGRSPRCAKQFVESLLV